MTVAEVQSVIRKFEKEAGIVNPPLPPKVEVDRPPEAVRKKFREMGWVYFRRYTVDSHLRVYKPRKPPKAPPKGGGYKPIIRRAGKAVPLSERVS